MDEWMDESICPRDAEATAVVVAHIYIYTHTTTQPRTFKSGHVRHYEGAGVVRARAGLGGLPHADRLRRLPGGGAGGGAQVSRCRGCIIVVGMWSGGVDRGGDRMYMLRRHGALKGKLDKQKSRLLDT